MTIEQHETEIAILNQIESMAFSDKNMNNWDRNYTIIMDCLAKKIKIYQELIKIRKS